jgi:hypothetical protein
MQNPWEGRMMGKEWFAFLRRNPGLTIRKAEYLSYGRLMRFFRETVVDIFKLLM